MKTGITHIWQREHSLEELAQDATPSPATSTG